MQSLTIDAICEILGISESTFRRRLQHESLSGFKPTYDRGVAYYSANILLPLREINKGMAEKKKERIVTIPPNVTIESIVEDCEYTEKPFVTFIRMQVEEHDIRIEIIMKKVLVAEMILSRTEKYSISFTSCMGVKIRGGNTNIVLHHLDKCPLLFEKGPQRYIDSSGCFREHPKESAMLHGFDDVLKVLKENLNIVR